MEWEDIDAIRFGVAASESGARPHLKVAANLAVHFTKIRRGKCRNSRGLPGGTQSSASLWPDLLLRL
jgi:hypothetical protein